MAKYIRLLMAGMGLFGLAFQTGLAQTDLQTAKSFIGRLANNGQRPIDVTIGALPGGVSVPLPQGADVLGSVSDKISRTVTIYYKPADLPAVYNAYVSALQNAGFTSETPTFPRQGFVASNGRAVPQNISFCRAAVRVLLSAALDRSDDLRVSVMQPAPGSPQTCSILNPAFAIRFSPLPVFAAPAGTTVAPIVQNYSPGPLASAFSVANITGNVSENAILGSLAGQLRAANWTIGPTVDGETFTAVSMQFGSGANAWYGAVEVYPGASSGEFVARVDAEGAAQQFVPAPPPLPQLSVTMRKSEESSLIRLMRRMFSEYAADIPQRVYVNRVPPNLDSRIPLPSSRPLGSLARTITDPMVANPEFTLYYTLTSPQLQSYYSLLNLKDGRRSVLAATWSAASSKAARGNSRCFANPAFRRL